MAKRNSTATKLSYRNRTEHIGHLRTMDPRARNVAIQNHIRKLEGMSDADWPAHVAKLDSMRAKFAPTAVRLASEAFQKTGRR